MNFINKYKLVIFLGLLFLLPIVAIVAQYNSFSDSVSQQGQGGEILTQNVNLITDSTEWSSGERHSVSVVVPDDFKYPPSVFDLYFIHDPDMFTLVDTQAGQIWSDANILSHSVQDGVVNVVAGQNFEASLTDNKTLAEFTFEVNSAASGSVRFSLSPESSYASTNIDSVILLNSQALEINLE